MSETTELRVMDFDCPSCASTVERALSNIEGVKHVEVHYSTGRVEIEYNDGVSDPDLFAQTIENQGYTPQPA